MHSIFRITILYTGLVLLLSCGGKNNSQEETAEIAAHAEENEAGETTLTSEQISAIGIAFGRIEKKQLTALLKVSGVLQVPNQHKASINSVYGGVIRSLLIEPGHVVARGQVIATIANPEFIQVQSDYLGIDSKMVLAEQEYNRQKELTAGNAGALKNLQAAEAALRALRTNKASLQQQIRLMGIDPASLANGQLVSVLAIRSPISGVVSNVMVKIGSYVDLSNAVAEVIDNRRMHVDLFVYEKDLSKIKNQQLIHFNITNNPGREYEAKIISLGPNFEQESKAVSVHALVQGNTTGLMDGMSVTAHISLRSAELPAVPAEAIVNHEGQDYIFIEDSVDTKKKEMVFRRIPVVKGTTDIGYSEISLLKEVPADAKVVIKGAFFIMARMTSSGEEGHAH